MVIPPELGDAWTLRKGEKVARCTLVTHPLGWELRLMTSDLLRSQVCRSSEEMLDTQESWEGSDDGARLRRGLTAGRCETSSRL